MLAPIIIAVAVCAAMIASVLFFPKLKIGKLKLNTYWLITLIGAAAVFLSSPTNVKPYGPRLLPTAT